MAGPDAVGTPADDLLENARQLLRNDGLSSADVAEAMSYLEEAGKAGSVEALVLLGDAYRLGQHDLELSPERAVSYYRQAAAAGNTGALVKLGDIHRTGLPGLPADPDQAIAFCEDAIALGDNGARRYLECA